MARQQIKHVVEKADPGGDVGHTGAVEVDGNFNVGFVGFSLDGGRAHEKSSPHPEIAPF
jgi:hypothetical protein